MTSVVHIYWTLPFPDGSPLYHKTLTFLLTRTRLQNSAARCCYVDIGTEVWPHLSESLPITTGARTISHTFARSCRVIGSGQGHPESSSLPASQHLMAKASGIFDTAGQRH